MNLGTTSILCASLGVLMMTLPANIQDTNQTAKGPEPVTSQKFAELSDQFMKASLALSPTLASSVGYHKHIDAKTGKTIWLDALLDDLSLESAAEQRAFFQQWRERFRVETPPSTLNPQDAADWQLIDDQIDLNLLEFDKIQSYRHNATVPVELIGNALFLPLTQEYAPKEVRLGHVLSRVGEIPRLLNQVEPYMSDVDAIFVQTAIEENDGNIDMIENTIAREIPPGSAEGKVRSAGSVGNCGVEGFFQVAAGGPREAPLAAHMAAREGVLRSKVQAGDGDGVETGATPGRRSGRAESSACRDSTTGAAHARPDVSKPRRSRRTDRARPGKSDHR